MVTTNLEWKSKLQQAEARAAGHKRSFETYSRILSGFPVSKVGVKRNTGRSGGDAERRGKKAVCAAKSSSGGSGSSGSSNKKKKASK